MEILIGRDTATHQLRLTAGEKSVLYGQADVPSSVLQQHCLIEADGDSLRLKNLNINAYTYVNGRAVEAKAVTRNDSIELGTDRYPLNWNALSPFLPADIRSLQVVWDNYEQQNIALQISERKFNTLRSATGLITMIAIALGIFTGGRSTWYIALYALAIITSLLFFVKAYVDSAKIPQKRQDLTRQFQHDYVCPQCGHFLGNQPYHILVQNDHCPKCKTQFIH